MFLVVAVGGLPVLQVADLGQELVVLVQERGVLAGEFVEAALVFGLVLGDAGIAGDQLVDRLGGSTHAGEELVGFDVQVGGVEFGAHSLVDQLDDLVPADEEVVDGVEERFRDLLFADVRGRASGQRGETGSSDPRMDMIYGLAKALDLYPQPRPTPGHPHSTRKSWKMWRKVTWLSSASTSEFTSTRQWPGRARAWPGFAVGQRVRERE